LRVGYENRVNDARGELGIARVFGGRPERTQEESRQRVLAYVKEHPEAGARDLREAGLAYELKRGYKNRINNARNKLGIPAVRGSCHKNTIAYDLWGLELEENDELRSQLGKTLQGLLSKSDFGIARKYYGLGCRKHTLDKIGKKLAVTGEMIRQRMEKIVSKLGYLNHQHALAQAYLPHAEGEARKLLSGIPAYNSDNFLPYRLDQLYFSGRNLIKPLMENRIVTIGQFFGMYANGTDIRGFGEIRQQRLLEELEKFEISSVLA